MKNLDLNEHSGFIYQGYIPRKITKKMTVNEWKKFDKDMVKMVGDTKCYLNLQQLLCKKYDIILTDYKVKRSVRRLFEKEIGSRLPKSMRAKIILKKFNQKNLDKGLKTFSDGVESFTKEIGNFSSSFGGKDEKLTKDLLGISGATKKTKLWTEKKPAFTKLTNSSKPQFNRIAGNPQKLKIWSDTPKTKPKKRKSKSKPRHETNMERIWGKRR
jgi:hypothetical protein